MAEDPMAWWEKRDFKSLGRYFRGDMTMTPEEKRKRLKIISLILAIEGAIMFLLYKAFMHFVNHN
jgi:hypothetical protein